jgi:hypothetical protein
MARTSPAMTGKGKRSNYSETALIAITSRGSFIRFVVGDRGTQRLARPTP